MIRLSAAFVSWGPTLALAFALLGGTGSGAVCRAEGLEHTKDSIEKIERNLEEQKAVLVDVREKVETDEGFVRGARRVPLSTLPKDKLPEDKEEAETLRSAVAKKIPRDKIVYTYCRSGGRAIVAAEILKTLGYDVRPLKHGFKDLVKEGFPAAAPE